MQIRPDLPPLGTLIAFEAAARLGSFSEAARSLNATQPAISQQIAALEAALGCPLFQRRPNGVALTAEGRMMAEAVSLGLAAIGRVTTALRQARQKRVLTVGTDYGFAGLWLMPRLGALADLLRGLEVRVVVAQSVPDPLLGEVDLAISMMKARPPGAAVTRLFGESVQAVASPQYWRRHGPPGTPHELLARRLLHLDGRGDAPWLSWAGFLAAIGAGPGPRTGDMHFNTYPLVVEAALMGQGVALGWSPLIDGLLASGRLVRAAGEIVRTDCFYGLIEVPERRADPSLAAFREWLMKAAAPARGELAGGEEDGNASGKRTMGIGARLGSGRPGGGRSG